MQDKIIFSKKFVIFYNTIPILNGLQFYYPLFFLLRYNQTRSYLSLLFQIFHLCMSVRFVYWQWFLMQPIVRFFQNGQSASEMVGADARKDTMENLYK